MQSNKYSMVSAEEQREQWRKKETQDTESQPTVKVALQKSKDCLVNGTSSFYGEEKPPGI